MILGFHLISGLMFGIEWVYEEGYLIVDLGIVRCVWDYRGNYLG